MVKITNTVQPRLSELVGSIQTSSDNFKAELIYGIALGPQGVFG